MRMSSARRLHLRAKQAFYFALCVLFAVDRWHARVVRENCGYFERVRATHRRLAAAVTVEVGCGLGEIISGLDSRLRVGVDRDRNVLRLARVLRGRSIRFLAAAEFSAAAAGIASGERACLVMLNWLHACDPAQALGLMGSHARATGATFVVFDIIHAGTAGYRYQHHAQGFAALGSIEAVEDAGDAIRSIVTLRVAATPGAT